jgi:hypothetical protein
MTKTYKTSEMIAMLEKNPKLKFTTIRGGITTSPVLVSESGYIVWENEQHNPPYSTPALKPDDEWQLVYQAVTWQEALQAWDKGKTIKCDMGPGEGSFTLKPLEESYRTGSTFCVYWLKAGTWYIEEPGE